MILAFRLIIGAIFLIALWDEDDRWKYWSLLVGFVFAMAIFQVEVEREAEKDGMCKMADLFNRSIDNSETLGNIKDITIDLEFCDG